MLGLGLGLTHRRGISLAALIRALFRDGEQGAWLDPSDSSALFQERTGASATTPAIPGDPVGTILDKSGNGNHALAPSDAARPVLGRVPATGRRNLLTRTEDIGNAAWDKVSGVTVATDTTTAPDGTTTADTIMFNTTNGNRVQQESNTLAVPGVTYTKSVWLSGSGTIGLNCAGSDGNGGETEITITLTGTLTRYSVTHTFTATATSSTFVRSRIIWRTGYTAVNVVAWGAQLETGSTPTPYQRVGSTFDVTEAGVQERRYLRDDGVDDALNVSLPDLGTNATVAYVSDQGVTIQTGQTIGAGNFDILRDSDLFGMIVIDRPLSANETANVTKYLESKGLD